MSIIGRLNQYGSMLANEFNEYSMSENLIIGSEFDHIQQSGNTTATANQLFVPYGRLTAVNFVNNGGAGNTYVYQNFNTSFTIGTQYVISIFSNTSTISFDQGGLAAGKYTILNSGSISLANNWWRHWVLYSATVDNPNLTPQVTIFPGNNITLSGWQLELGSSVTNYTPTTTTTISRSLPSTTNTNITGLGIYYSAGFDENSNSTSTLAANVFQPYNIIYDEIGGTLVGPGQGRYMRQNGDKSVIVYNEIDEITDLYGRGIIRDGLVLDLDAGISDSFAGRNYYITPQTLTDGRTGTTSGGNYTDFTTGGPTNGRFTRWVRDTALTRTADWDWSIGYTNTGLSVGQILTVSFYARCPNGTLSTITLNSPDSLAINGILDSTWRRYSGTIIYGGDYVSTPFIRINRGNTNAYVNGATYDIAQIQIEKGSVLTDFVDETTWTDLSVYGNNGTLINGPTYSDANGRSIVFDGNNDYSLITQTLTTPITISSFVRYTDQAKTLNTLINSNPHTVIGISLNRLGGGELYVYIGNGSGWLAAPSIISSSNMLVNTWYQVTFTSNGSGSTLYLNGNNVGTSIYSPSGWGSTYYLGALNFGGEYLKGNIATTQIYNRALTQSEIQQNYNALKNRFGL